MRTLPAILSLLIGFAFPVRAQWLQQKSGTTTELTDVVALDSITAMAVGRDGSILKTTDAGQTWVILPLQPLFFHPWNAVSFSSPLSGAVAGDFGRVATTTDGGDNWRWRGVPSGGRLLTVLEINPSNIYAGDDSGWVYHSLDSGQTWSSERISTWPIRSLFPWTGAYVWGLPLYALTPFSLFANTDFPGGSWNETILSAFLGLGSEAFRGVYCPGGGAGFIVGVWGDLRAAPAIVRKSFPDSIWRPSATGLLGDGALLGVAAPSTSTVYVCSDQGMISRSTNGGDSWTTLTVLSARRLNAISFADELRGYAVGDSGTIFYTSNGGVTAVGAAIGGYPAAPELLQNYPNPFNPMTSIKYSIPVGTYGRTSLHVFDLLGREVAVLVNERKAPGTYAVSFDGSALASGVYLYRLVAGSFMQTRRMVLLK